MNQKAPRPFDSGVLEQRPIIVAIAGSNGAGKTSFYHAHLRQSGLRFLNADVIAREMQIDPYAAARALTALREEFVKQRESFIFETVFSDPVGDKLGFLKKAIASGYQVVLCFIGISDPDVSEQRVAIRVSQGGHDVPRDKLIARFPRTIANLHAALQQLPLDLIFDNDDLRHPFRHVATYQHGRRVFAQPPLPKWLRAK